MNLAHVTVARLRFPPGAPELREFERAADAVLLLAEQSPGFVWRYPARGGHVNGAELLGDPLALINVSLWESYGHLHAYVFRTVHGRFLHRRRRWFEAPAGPQTALWWVPEDERPSPAEALHRLRYLRCYGPTRRAFTMRRRFTADGRRVSANSPRQMSVDGTCVA